MTTDLIDKMRAQQLYFAEIVGDRIYAELKPYVRSGDLNGLEGFVYQDINKIRRGKIDLEALSVCLRNAITDNVLSAIHGYTDWLVFVYFADAIMTRKVPDKVDFEMISERYGVPPKLLERTVQILHEQKSLPLIGKIQQGYILPDRKKIEAYKSRFDVVPNES